MLQQAPAQASIGQFLEAHAAAAKNGQFLEAPPLEAMMAVLSAPGASANLLEAAVPTASSFHNVSSLPASFPAGQQAHHKTKLCQHWQQFKCNYGDMCNFSHDCLGGPGDGGRGLVQAQAQAANASVAQAQAECTGAAIPAAGMSNAELLAALGLNQNGSHGGQQTQNTRKIRTKLCKHWQNHRCNRGDECNFSHDCEGGVGDHGFGLNVPPIAGGGPQQWQYLPQQQEPLVQQQQLPPEALFDGTGSVQQLEQQVGAAVALLQNPVVQQLLASNNSVEGAASSLCQAFFMGGCVDGDSCQFSHDASSAFGGVAPSLAGTGLQPGFGPDLTSMATTSNRFFPY